VTISWSHPDLKTLLPDDLYDRLKECQPDVTLDSKERGCEGVMLRDGATGEVMVMPHFPNIRRLNLQKWRKILGEGANVQFGKALESISTDEDGVTAHFSDGTSERGSILIGTDGGSSAVRTILLPGADGQAESLNYEFLNFPVQFTAEQALWMDKEMHPIVDVGVHPKSMYCGVFLLDKEDLERPETWKFYILATWPKEKGVTYSREDDMLPELRKRMTDWADPFKSAVEWAPNNHVRIMPGGLRVWAPKKAWDNRGGRVTLGGDAAHSKMNDMGSTAS
jgi:2-polyprenyl-6-methoxyphenol hydroxylase-like FAD-dependent oxidoreductase